MHSRWMQTDWNSHRTIYKNVRITYFCWSNREIIGMAKNSSTNSGVVPRHGRTCSEMCWAILKKVEQLYKVVHPCLDDHQFKKEELESVGELSVVCSQIVLKCLYLARIGRLDVLLYVNKLARSVTKWTQVCDKRLARLISYIYSSHKWLSSILSWGKHSTALQTWSISRLRLCRRPWEFIANLRWCLVFFWKQNICPSQLGAQAANCGFAQFYRIWNYFSGCWTTYGWVTCSRSLGHCDWSFTNNQGQYSTQSH